MEVSPLCRLVLWSALPACFGLTGTYLLRRRLNPLRPGGKGCTVDCGDFRLRIEPAW